MTTPLQRAQGCLIGQLAGDNLGALCEFQSEATIAKRYPNGGPAELVDGGVWRINAGQPTDDGEMALALARSLVAQGGFDAACVTLAYETWLRSMPFDCGNTVRDGIGRRGAGLAPATHSQANGALMRVSPIGIAYAGKPGLAARHAAADAAITHPHPVCVAASAAYASAIAALVGGASVAQAVDAATAGAAASPEGMDTVVSTILDAADGFRPAKFDGGDRGWVILALANAFFWLGQEDASPQEAIVETIRKGGDTDTTAAIAGALKGAAMGITAFPDQWIDAIAHCKVAGEQAMRPRPATYHPNDAEALAAALLEVETLSA